MWRAFLTGFLSILSLGVVYLSFQGTELNVNAKANPQPLSEITSYSSGSNLPDPNIIYEQINKIRQENGLPKLIRSRVLANIAQQRAQDMAENKYYAHQSPSGAYFYDFFSQHNYAAGYSCENLDLEFSRDPDIYVNAWLASKNGHRECLLNPKVIEAGYASVQVSTSTETNIDVPSYIVVAIYAEKSDTN